MPDVNIRAVVRGREPDEVLAAATDFAKWPEMSDAVVSVRVDPGEGESTSYWEVLFREGILKWSQRDQDVADTRRAFELIEGDPLVWHGAWSAEASGGDTHVRLDAEFDLGMPSLSHVLDPMGVEAIEDAVQSVMRGLFGDDVEVEFGRTTEGAA